MNILLIQPKMKMRPMDTTLKTRMSPSLGLLTIAAILEEEHHVTIVNENIEEIDFQISADLVGITVTVDVMPRAIEIAERFRARGIPVVAGGIHITAFPDSGEEYFDTLCIGMAETTWPDIVRDYEAGKLQKRYYCGGKITGADIVSPAYHLIDRSQYLYCNIVSTSRGCPFRCDFCYNSCEAYQKLYINRPVEHVIADIRAIGMKHIMLIDDNLIGNPAWTREFLEAIRPMKLKWNAAVSANIVDMPDLLDLMAETGCQSLFIGLESLNAAAIDKVSKGQNHTDQYEKLVEEIHKRGIMINASFVFGLDGDDQTTFQSTVDWIVKHRIETVTSHILTPYPGTALYNRMKRDGRITQNDFSLYNTAHVVFRPEKMTEEELYEGYLYVYRKVYSFRNILKRIPKAKHQIMPYLLFNLFYRKFGRFTERLCRLISYERIGKWAEIWSKYL